jgi:hypothetical protein
MGTTNAECAPLLAVSLPVDERMLAVLHRAACVVCGRTTGPLVDAGHCVTISGDGARLGWPVAACPDHDTERS